MRGFKIVLTADRTLMSEYGGHIFLGFSACVPRGLVPDRFYFSVFCPPVEANSDGSARYAPCGARKIEAALLDYGFKRDEVIVAHPEHLGRVIGACTKVVGITENDPLGIGPATSTFTQILGGEAYMALKFKELLNHPSIKRFSPKIIVGGPGAWQLEDEGVRRKLGVDCVVIGEGEKVAGPLFEKAIKGEDIPEVVYGDLVQADEVPLIRGPTITGVVEIARGCGRGCKFCAPTLLRYRCFSLEHILKEIDINLRAGRQPCLHAEDVLRYKAKGFEVNKEAVVELFRAVKSYPGVNSIGISHFSLASVSSAPEVVEEISRIVDENGKANIGGITGIETGSPKLIEKHMPGKCKPFKPEDWPQIILNSFEILSENGWVPCATLILGLPGEEEKDIDFTIDLVDKLGEFKSLVVPLFFVSVGGLRSSNSFTIEKMTFKHSELFLKCWEHNFRWAPKLLSENLDKSIKNRFVRAGVKLAFSYAIREGKELIYRCRREYNCDVRAMIEDARRGELAFGKIPSRLMRLVQAAF